MTQKYYENKKKIIKILRSQSANLSYLAISTKRHKGATYNTLKVMIAEGVVYKENKIYHLKDSLISATNN